MKKLVLFCVAVLGYAMSFATVRFVNASATGLNNGVSWTNAYTSLQSAIGATLPGDTIWVANGVYKPTTSTTSTSRQVAFEIPTSVRVFGGFAGTETALSQRNFSTFQTILSGDIGTGAVTSDNSYNVVRMSNTSVNTRLDGFKIISGNANSSSFAFNQGGGIYAENCNATIANCIISDNRGYNGGGMHIRGTSNVPLLDCRIESNIADNAGGGLFVNQNIVTARRCTFDLNTASDGGGVYIDDAEPVFDQCTFGGNTGSSEGGAIYIDQNSTIALFNSLIVGNLGGSGSAYYALISTFPQAITNCTFVHNRSTAASNFTESLVLNGVTNFRNNIVWGNQQTSSQQVYLYFLSGATLDRNIIQGGTTYAAATNTFDTDPRFLAPGAAASAPFAANGYDYRLAAISLAVDTGANAAIPANAQLDLDNNTRIVGGLVDLGAYEGVFCPLTASITLSTPSATICNGNSTTLTATGGSAFSWSNGSIAPAITVNAAGTYKVIVANAANCRGVAYQTIAVSNPQPAIQETSGVLSTGTFTAYQWMQNGAAISGATTQSYTPSAGGTYTVTVTDAGGCTGISSPFQYTPAGIADAALQNLAAYPNPANDLVFIYAANVKSAEIFSLDGRVVLRQTHKATSPTEPMRIDVHALPVGMYLLRIVGSKGMGSQLLRIAR